LTPGPPKSRKKKTKRKQQLPSKKAVNTKCTTDQVGISIRKEKNYGPPPRCPYCNESVPQNKWRVINRVKRNGNRYDVKQIHIFHAKLVLLKDEFQQLLTELRSYDDAEIVEKGQLGYSQCTREWEKVLKQEQHGGVAVSGSTVMMQAQMTMVIMTREKAKMIAPHSIYHI
jgi:hypothetical protein